MRSIEVQRRSLTARAANFMGLHTHYTFALVTQKDGATYLNETVVNSQYKVVTDQDLDHTSGTFGQFTTPLPF